MKVYIITRLADGVSDVVIEGVFSSESKALQKIEDIAKNEDMRDITKSSYLDHIKEFVNAGTCVSLDEYELKR